MSLRSWVLAPTLALVGACAESTVALDDSVDSLDSGASGYSGPFAVESAAATCTPGTPDQWRFDVRTQGWAGSVALTIFESGSDSWPTDAGSVRSETHPLGNVAYDDEGTWDEYSLLLHAVDDVALQSAGASTLWGCAYDTAVGGVGGALAWRLLMYDAAPTPRPVDCVVWGYQSAQVYGGGAEEPTCRCLDVDADCTN